MYLWVFINLFTVFMAFGIPPLPLLLLKRTILNNRYMKTKEDVKTIILSNDLSLSFYFNLSIHFFRFGIDFITYNDKISDTDRYNNIFI